MENKLKTAFLFPGQGSQYIGMGKELYDNFAIARKIYNEANEILDMDLQSLCFNGPVEKLTLTANTQPALLVNSVIVSKILEDMNITASIGAGHSLGEYSALVTAGALSLQDGIAIVRKRGTFMQEAVSPGKGAMAAIIGLSGEEIKRLCRKCPDDKIVVPANFNSPIQTVIAGEKEAVEATIEAAKKEGAKKAVMLQVSAPFHCSLMKPAEERLARELDKIIFSNLNFPVITNVDAKEITSGSDAKSSLKRQVSSAVLWEASMKHLAEKSIDLSIEVGPGKVLSGLMKRISREIKVLNVEDMKSLEKTLKKIEGEERCH